MKSNKKVLWIALIAVAIVGICVSVFLFAPDTNTAKNAVQCDKVQEEGQNAYIDLVGISPKFATYEGYEKLGLHFCEDVDGIYYIIAINEDNMKNYQAQLFYWSGITEKAPAAARVTGKAYKIDSEIKRVAINMLDDSSINNSNFADYFGKYYINTNVSTTSNSSFLAAVIVLFISIVILAIGLYNFFANNENQYDSRYGLAIACGVFGLIVGSLIPMALGMFLKTISWYAIIAIPFGFQIGYSVIEKRMNFATKILYVLLSTFMGFVSMYVVYAWTYYNGMNDGTIGLSFIQAASSLLDNLDSFKDPGKVKMYLALGPIITFIISLVMAAGNKNNKQVEQAVSYDQTHSYINPDAMNFGQTTQSGDANNQTENKVEIKTDDNAFGYFGGDDELK